MAKEKTQLVLVETISQFRMRYVVEVPEGIDNYGNDKALWALDTVTMEEGVEFSQKWLGETIVSHRVIDKAEAVHLFAEDDVERKTPFNWKDVKRYVTRTTEED